MVVVTLKYLLLKKYLLLDSYLVALWLSLSLKGHLAPNASPYFCVSSQNVNAVKTKGEGYVVGARGEMGLRQIRLVSLNISGCWWLIEGTAKRRRQTYPPW